MRRKTTLECTKHGLRFEQFDDWHETKGGAVPNCYMCAHQELESLRVELHETARQRDVLMAAIDVKLAVPVSPGRELSNG